jgi:hypothetical protein
MSRSFFRRKKLSSSANRSRECAPDDKLRRAIQYSRVVAVQLLPPRRTGYPAFAGYDDVLGLRAPRNEKSPPRQNMIREHHRVVADA